MLTVKVRQNVLKAPITFLSNGPSGRFARPVAPALHEAESIVSRLRGSCGALLVSDTSCRLWVTKFTSNAMGPRMLINEFLATQLAKGLALTVPTSSLVTFSSRVLEEAGSLLAEERRHTYQAGTHFGSEFVGALLPPKGVPGLSSLYMSRLENKEELLGALILDIWLGNEDFRQVVYVQQPNRPGHYRAFWIDFSHCFGALDWDFKSWAVQQVRHSSLHQYADWTKRSVRPWLERILAITRDDLESVVSMMPPEWIASQLPALDQLISSLLQRRSKLDSILQDLVAERSSSTGRDYALTQPLRMAP